ncbi:hypothetical protein EGW08_011447 [Elysia chlorotica]|uniref:C-type lectin domain-containing protein n=1 Tax=Elysia chlorotica TaxID=188477 RepID=A0A3S1C222_ELYCH|nr:hypothetical protein EGW08_011447 [Elysia chlorotica]
MFDFLVTDRRHNYTDQEKKCQGLGYDGLAVVSTPEALEYANKISYYTRIVLYKEMYVGNHLHLDTNEFLWDDGTVMTPDTPLDVHYSHQPCTRLKTTGTFARGGGTGIQYGICGNHDNPPRQSSASGSMKHGEQLQTTARTVLSEGTALSYLECFVLCGMDSHCRLAEFNSDLLTCAVIGEYTSSDDNPPKQSSASGSIKHGEQLQTTARTVLSEGTAVSYLECFLLCGMDSHCRLAEFNSDLLTCAVIGEYTSSADAELEDGSAKLEDDSAKLEDGSAKLEDGSAKLEDGSAKLEDGSAKLEDGSAKLEDGSAKLEDGSAKLEDGSSKLEDGSSKLEDGSAEARRWLR